MNDSLNRRRFVQSSLAIATVAGASRESSAVAPSTGSGGERQATGVRAGEMTDTTAIVRVRITEHETRNNKGLLIPGRANKKTPEQLAKVTVPVDELEGACPGASGRVRLRYGTDESLGGAVVTDWVDVSEATDFSHQFRLSGLKPGTVYHYASETAGPGGTPEHAPLRGRFETAPSPDAVRDVRFCVMTCQAYPDRDHPDGHNIYPSMLALRPQFACLTGDLVYYDNDEPRATNPRLARFHWERMFSLPRLREFTRKVGTYWLKDDHDTLDNDSWPGRKLGTLTFAEGQAIFREQAPLSEGPSYRTVRWGRDLQLWFTDGRDERSPNTMPDGPRKTIWGTTQKEWFKRTVAASDATWKILVSPTPLVGPDRPRKHDNHSNSDFRHEGDELRAWIAEHAGDNFFVICGDRHWQYHSVHPQTGLHEFSVGPASDQHAGGTPGEDRSIHRFHRVAGGFLAVQVSRNEGLARINFELRNVGGQVVHEWIQTRPIA
jgi:alkaline phosphatase D